MELLLALVVVTAVILFGALISIGNERQRRAIVELREQVVLWAIQDLRIKREHLAREVRVDDPLIWLNLTAGRILAQELRLQVVETFDEPQTLVCTHGDDNQRIIFSTLSPDELKHLKSGRQNRLSNFATGNPLLSLPRKIVRHELSVLNCGFLFDLELPLAWSGITGCHAKRTDRLWMYLLPW